MADFDTGKEVNSKKMQVYIGSTSNEWKLIQNARVLISHPIFREPTTGGTVVTYTGAPDNSISGTLFNNPLILPLTKDLTFLQFLILFVKLVFRNVFTLGENRSQVGDII